MIDHSIRSVVHAGAGGVAVIDGRPSTLALVGSMTGQRAYPLGVTCFGESGIPAEPYRACRSDWESIYEACCVAVEDG